MWQKRLEKSGITYLNENSNSTVKELSITHNHKNGEYRVQVEAFNNEKLKLLLQALLSTNFPSSNLHHTDNLVSAHSHHPGLLGNFLEVVKAIEPDFSQIENEICTSLKIKLTQPNFNDLRRPTAYSRHSNYQEFRRTEFFKDNRDNSNSSSSANKPSDDSEDLAQKKPGP